jgi:hypothetical protein
MGQKVAWYTQRYSDRAATNFNQHARWEIITAKKENLDPTPVACAWIAVGVLTPEYVKKSFDITCATADVPLVDSCEGRDDGVYCSQLESYSAIVCMGGTISSGQQCESPTQKCVGPNGAGDAIVCR